ncbi:MAG TPA: hypothetical protein VKH81_19465 [Candidatus Angelobacter sp.]|nr:hypothetical protein [Candidatus Angelobacter sp.]
MEELILWLLGLIFECVVEVVGHAILECVVAVIGDLLLRVVGAVFEEPAIQNAALAYAGYLAFGVLLGAISLTWFPRHLVHPARIHGISLLVAPAVTGLLMSTSGAVLRRNNKKTLQLESFGYGFAFAFGVAAIRLLLAR